MTDKEIVERAKEAEKRTGFGELVHSPISKGVNSAYGIGFIEGMVEYRNSLQQESASEDLEEAAKNHAAERYKATRDMVLAEKCKWSFKAGAEWNFERIKEALLSKVLPYFMHGGEADEVVAKLDEVLNQK